MSTNFNYDGGGIIQDGKLLKCYVCEVLFDDEVVVLIAHNNIRRPDGPLASSKKGEERFV